MNNTKVQKTMKKSNSFNGNDFLTAKKLANSLQFQEFEVNEDTGAGNNWFGLFIAENNAYWAISMVENGDYNLECDDAKVCLIDKSLSIKIEALRKDILSEPLRKIKAQNEFQAFQNELLFNYGYGKI